jgi:chemotaxis protein MotA
MMSGGNVNVREMQDLMDDEPATHRAESSVAANADH